MKPEDMKVIIIIGDGIHGVYGIGDTIKEARDKAVRSGKPRKTDIALVYVCHPETAVSLDDGALIFPHEFPPKQIAKGQVWKVLR